MHNLPQTISKRRVNSRTAANTTPSLNAAILAMTPGTPLDELVERSVLRGTAPGKARGSTATWDGARVIINRLTTLGCILKLEIHPNSCHCSVYSQGDGEDMKELAEAEAHNLPETVAKAAILACISLEARTEKA
jgi:hypothetical protein